MSGISMSCPLKEAGGERFVARYLSLMLPLICRYVLAAVFLMAATTKTTDMRGFGYQLDLHSGLPERLSVVIAAVLPWLELTCGASLAFGKAVREAALLLALLLTALLVYALTHAGSSDCRCFLFP